MNVPLDILTIKQVKSYIFASPLRSKSSFSGMFSVLRTIEEKMEGKTHLSNISLTGSGEDADNTQLAYFQKQFALLGPNENDYIGVQNFKMVLSKCVTDAMKGTSS